VTTIERLRELLHRDFQLPAERLTPEARLEELEIDSLRMIEILFSVEEAFGITVPADPAEIKARVSTFGDLAAYIDELVRSVPLRDPRPFNPGPGGDPGGREK
jgi:acyl carrier protein